MTTGTAATRSSTRLGAEERWWAMSTPVGRLLLAGDDKALRSLRLPGDPVGVPFLAEPHERGKPKSVAMAIEQLEAYFAGELREFDVPLAPAGTAWQQKVWSELRNIPFGETTSYGEVARRVGNPAACRAVGAANNRNPIAIVIPCHRVIGADGGLTGYGGGLPLKELLLAHERRALQRP